MAEFLVLATALIPVFLLMPVIAKYQDIAHATQAASRYAAFDATIHNDGSNGWKAESQLAAEVRRRFFSNSNAPIKTNDVAGNFAAHRNLFWSGPVGEPLIADINSDVSVSFGASGGTTHISAFQPTRDGAPFDLRDRMDLQSRGIYRANVAVRLADLPAGLRYYVPFDAIGLVVSRNSSLLIDPWTSSGPDQTDERAAGDPQLFPAAELREFSALTDSAVASIDALGGVRAPRLGELDFWQDVVPADRLR